MLGPLRVTSAGGPIAIVGRHERVVLAALAAFPREGVSVRRLEDLLWGDDAPRSGVKLVQNVVLRLRKLLGAEVIETRPGGYALAASVDTIEFEHLIENGRALASAGDWRGAALLLRAAVRMWSGPSLTELGDWTLGRSEAVRLDELGRLVREELAEAELASGRHQELVPMLEAMVSEEPLRERRWTLLMLSLHRSGRQAEALRAFQRAREAFDEVGLELGQDVVALDRAIGTNRCEGATSRSGSNATTTASFTQVSRRFADLRAPQLAEALDADSILVQPLGAIEQHGPHLPYSTDLVIAERVAEAAVDRVGDELGAWLLPPLAYTKSNEHAWSAGTIWLSADTLLRVLDDIGRCVATTPARKLVFFNGHGGNSALLGVANREVRLAHGLQTFLTHPGVPPDQGGLSAPEELGMGVHGGTDETSMMLHLAPDLVDMSLATRNVPEKLASNKYVRFGGKVGFGWLSNDFGPDGHIGDPTNASAEHGAALFEAAVAAFSEALAEIAAFDFGR